MRKNWKTTFLGAASIISGVAKIFLGDVHTGVTVIMAGIGLIFSKDYDNK
jgi:hypothetical protein